MNPARRTTQAATTALVLATAGTLLSSAAPAASAATTCVSPVYKRQFFANTTFSGTPKRTDCDATIAENWGTKAPATGLAKDNFGVRWTVTRDFGSGGPFALPVAAQDGVRVYLDGKRKVDVWKNVSSTVRKTVNVTIPSGKHTLRVDYVNWTGSANVSFAYAPRTAASIDKVKPLAPTGASVAYDTTTGKAKLTWSKNTEMDLAEYRVYRRYASGNSWMKVGSTKSTVHTDVPPATGAGYAYEVRAVDKAGNISAGGADQAVTSVRLTTPTGLAATGTDKGIQLTWKPVPGAVTYIVRRSDESAYTVTGPSFTDNTVKRSVYWSYQVMAMGSNGTSSGMAETAEIRRLVAAPTELKTPPGKTILTWIVPKDPGDYWGYHVYRSTTLPVDTSVEPISCDTSWKILADGRGQYTCTDWSTAPGATYHYVVKAFDGTYDESVASATVTVTKETEDLTPPAPITGLTAKATEYGTILDWNDSDAPDLMRYILYRGKITSDGQGSQVCSAVQYARLDTNTSQYRDVPMPNGDRFCYFVDAVDTSDNSGYLQTGKANTVVVATLDLMPSVATPEDSPVTLNAIPSVFDEEVDLRWDEVPGATGYRVYRWNPGASAYEQLGAVPASYSSYDDFPVKGGTTYFYWVTAIYADGTESAPGGDFVAMAPEEERD
ncbi:hypothetical protein GCM10023084_60900 [Streptomyces lacrimifluminis]|uniref:PA14 domain-containing protein n=1 Tax=Streptomyces lacrimifluminis TaxID=1500077 RepID=A0A917NVW6_9ACTN|nr:PA14 domain-containing protein [Streptomyces lacrimifluminis]GGJ33185.1 hypothetical protein GCM10012282_32270 [Streptomyces lacrimifluminis]